MCARQRWRAERGKQVSIALMTPGAPWHHCISMRVLPARGVKVPEGQLTASPSRTAMARSVVRQRSNSVVRRRS